MRDLVHPQKNKVHNNRDPFEVVPLVEFIYLVLTRMPGEVTVGESGLLLCPSSVERY